MKEARYAERQRAKGFSLVKVWVPTGTVDDLKAYAKSLRLSIEEEDEMKCGPQKTMEILDELEPLGFTDEQFRSMHHLGTPIEKHRAYCAERSQFQEGSDNEILCFELMVLLLKLKKKKG